VGEGVCLQTLAPRGNVLFACLTFDSIARSLCLALYTLALSLAPGALPSWVFTARTCPQCFQAHHIRLGPEPSHPSSSGCATAATYRLSLKFWVYQTCGVSARFPACKRALWEESSPPAPCSLTGVDRAPREAGGGPGLARSRVVIATRSVRFPLQSFAAFICEPQHLASRGQKNNLPACRDKRITQHRLVGVVRVCVCMCGVRGSFGSRLALIPNGSKRQKEKGFGPKNDRKLSLSVHVRSLYHRPCSRAARRSAAGARATARMWIRAGLTPS
jgi:hypothetical protein